MKSYHVQGGLSLKNLVKSFQNAFRGLRLLLRYEYNLYIEIFLGCVALVLAFLFHVRQDEWFAIIIVIGLVVFAELTNTAIEKILDFVHPDYHEQVRNIKDLAAGSVVFTVIISLIVGGMIFVPRIVSLISLL